MNGEDAGPFVRAFAAIDISGETRAALVRVQGRLRRIRVRVGWTAPENLHLTIAFFGDCTREQLGRVAGGMDAAAGAMAPFSFETHGIGFFGRPRSPRVVWAGVRATPGPAVDAVAAGVQRAARDAGIPVEDRPFHAHVTLGRVRAAAGAADLVAACAAWEQSSFGRTEVDGVRIMRSELRADGPVYTVLHESRLGGSR